MLTFEQIKELIDQVASHRLNGFELEKSGFRLKIDGQAVAGAVASSDASPPVVVSAPVAPAAPVAAPPPPAAAPAPEAAAPSLPPNAHVLNSPIVGTFYRAPNPDAANFVEVGDRVSKGQVLCIVEAMKLMNEIESDAAGEILEIYVENGQPVEYGEPLFAIKAG